MQIILQTESTFYKARYASFLLLFVAQMSDTELTYFNLLKREIARQLRTTFPEVDQEIEAWKGKEIRHLQEDLIRSVNGRVSEKWFYTHIKSAHEHLPRIDMLDLLSQYSRVPPLEPF
ncbi:hypothetical protein [Catalinimonas alkaloidigena]|uniref:hypothetical protein n=1 Tax=Catalinimonas alkaloidigena TaxID=1075417 RepID=UPI002407620F|nr:hypothetical protein [Catalinimonas alkaloidigena]